MDQRTTPTSSSSSASASADAVPTRTHSRPTPRRTPSELSALSKSILSLHDDLSFSNDNTNTNHVHYVNEADSSSDHSRSHSTRATIPTVSKGHHPSCTETPFSTISRSNDSSKIDCTKSNSKTHSHQPTAQIDLPRSTPSIMIPQITTTAQLVNSRQPTGQGHSSGSSPKLSDRSSDLEHHNRDMTEDTLIMPQIITGSEQDLPHIGTVDSDRGRPARNVLSSSPTVLEVMGPLPRMITPSPVPLHARLSKIQREAKRGARVIDMETNGSSHHYDYEDVTDSSHDFSSRRHSVAEEDVCYPLPATDLEINYTALEDYIRLEQIKTQNMMAAAENGTPKVTPGPQARTKSATGGLLSKLRGASFTSSTPLSAKSAQDSNYGSIPGKNFGIPERGYSLFGERDKTQVPLDDAYRFTLYSTASVTVHAQTLGEIPPRGQTLSNMLQAGYFWLDVLAPTDEEIRMLSQISFFISQVFRVHPLTTEDILMEEGREKCEMFLNYYFVCFRTFVLDPSSHNFLNPMSIYTLVFPGGIISYHFRPVPHCRNVRKRIRHLKDRIEVTPDWINYAIIDDIVDTFAPLIGEIETEVDMIDELVLILTESEQSDMLRRIGNCRKRVMSLLRLLTGKADVIKGLIKRYEGRMGRKNMGEIGLFMGDIQDHIITMLQNLSHCEKILSRSHSNYLAQINIEMTSASNETNDVLTKLTVLGSIVLPMNLVTGLWGMNVPVPGQESEDLTWFFWIVTAIFIAAGLFLLIARKIKLL
ncbi:CorA metal ion transporter [Linnemannia hyalina]|uniref:CorA metal ion transporter n=1 Tax=Linnemannia hyalina TaxID=64524 RepID=A0A9P8BY77_9FUNG|nr:CorA metal ion transporter [Linnemannia hyalina]